jgi:hypothetical protein
MNCNVYPAPHAPREPSVEIVDVSEDDRHYEQAECGRCEQSADDGRGHGLPEARIRSEPPAQWAACPRSLQPSSSRSVDRSRAFVTCIHKRVAQGSPRRISPRFRTRIACMRFGACPSGHRCRDDSRRNYRVRQSGDRPKGMGVPRGCGRRKRPGLYRCAAVSDGPKFIQTMQSGQNERAVGPQHSMSPFGGFNVRHALPDIVATG